jgi:hypothetical protein
MATIRKAVRSRPAPLVGPLPLPAEADILARAFGCSLVWTRAQLGHWFPQDSPTILCRRLQRLSSRGILDRLRLTSAAGSGQYAYFLTRLGSQLLLGPTVARPRGHIAQDLFHSLGVSRFYLALQAQLEPADAELLQWWGQAASLCYLDGRAGAYVNPDAAFLLGSRVEQLFLLEYDRAPSTSGATQFLNKLYRYLRYYEDRVYRAHLGTGSLQPILLCLFEDADRLERIRDRARAILDSTPAAHPTVLFGVPQAIDQPLGPWWVTPHDSDPCSLLDERLR